MGRFDFQSPGSAFAEEMTQLLAERKAEERQRMLDKLTMDQEKRAAEEQANQQAYREQQMTSQRQQDEMARVAMLEKGMSIHDDPSTRLSPEDFRLFERYGRVEKGNPAGTPMVSTDQDFRMEDGQQLEADNAGPVSTEAVAAEGAPSYRYVGTPEERDRERKRKEQGNLITGMLTSGDPERVEMGKMLATIASANDGELPMQLQAMLFEELMPEQQGYIFDVENGTVRPTGTKFKRGAPVFTQTRPPRDTTANQPRPIPGMFTEDGHPLIWDPVSGRITAQDDVTVGGREQSGGRMGVPQDVLKQHNLVTAALTAEGNEPSQETLSLFRSSALGIIQNSNIGSARVRQIAVSALTNYPAAMEAAAAIEDFTPTEAESLERLLSMAIPPWVRPAIIAASPKRKKQEGGNIIGGLVTPKDGYNSIRRK